MENALQFGPITDKLNKIEIVGQGCLSDCSRAYYTGDGFWEYYLPGGQICTRNIKYDAHWSVEH